MKTFISVLLAAATAAAFVTAAAATATRGEPGAGPSAYPMDCTTAKDKTRCAALNKDIAACRDKIGDEWRECMHQPAPDTRFSPPRLRDCTKASNTERCIAHNAALEACNDSTTRAAHRKCMQGPRPAPVSR